MDLRSRLNTYLRRQATRFPPEHALRRWAAGVWAWYLARAGGYVAVPIHGEPIRLDVSFRSYPLDYEQEAVTAFLNLIVPGDVVWDIGANVGIYTLLAARETGRAGHVVAWEPSPATFRLLT